MRFFLAEIKFSLEWYDRFGDELNMKLLTATIMHECNVFMPLMAGMEHIRSTGAASS